VDYDFGSRGEQIDEFFRAKRPWSRVKDTILDKYIDAYLRTIQDRGSEILLIDGFAGPGRFGDDSDGYAQRTPHGTGDEHQQLHPVRCR
jgi:hypothetical protein